MRSSERLLQIPFYGLKTTHIISNVSLHLTDEWQSECLNTIFRLHWNLRRKIMEYLKLSFRNRACCIFGTTGNTVCQNTTRQSWSLQTDNTIKSWSYIDLITLIEKIATWIRALTRKRSTFRRSKRLCWRTHSEPGRGTKNWTNRSNSKYDFAWINQGKDSDNLFRRKIQ